MTSIEPHGDDKVLSYHNVLLRQRDVQLLSGQEWLNDQIIDFFWEYLREEKYANCQRLSLIDSSVCFFFIQGDQQDLSVLAAPLQLTQKDIVLFPVNNSTELTSASSGTHWSLLVFTRDDRRFHHFNSLDGTNSDAAAAVAKAAWPLLMDRQNAAIAGPVLKAKTSQQNNAYDCGVYMLEFADVICSVWERRNRLPSWHQEAQARLQAVNQSEIERKRNDLLRLITSRIDISNVQH